MRAKDDRTTKIRLNILGVGAASEMSEDRQNTSPTPKKMVK